MSAVDGDVDLDVKSFLVAAVPPTWVTFPLPPDDGPDDPSGPLGLAIDPVGSGQIALRLRGAASAGAWQGEAHVDVASASATVSGLGPSSGVARGAPELVDLSVAEPAEGLSLSARVDRLWLGAEAGPLRVTAGRQAVSFGTGLVFTPMDVVAPFGAATIDTEHRPGVDALRVEGFAGTSTTAGGVLAWVGDGAAVDGAAVADLLAVGTARTTVGVTDLLALGGAARGDALVGAGFVTSLGPVGAHGEATWTEPTGDETGFLRAVVGADGRPSGKTAVAAELYGQSWGASDPADYLAWLGDARLARGELWTVGHVYAAVSASVELTPLVSASTSVIGNVLDPSMLLAPSLGVSVGDDAAIALGAFLPLGARPDEVIVGIDPLSGLPRADEAALAASVRSEFGLYPLAAFASVRAWL